MTAEYFEAHLLSFYPQCLRFATHYTRSCQTAEDCVQEAYLRAWVGKDQCYADDLLQLKHWLMEIVANCCCQAYRNTKRRERLLAKFGTQPATREASVENQLIGFERQQQIQHAMRSMPKLYRGLIEQHFVHGMPLRDLAQFHGSNQNGMKSRLRRATEFVERKLQKKADGRRAARAKLVRKPPVFDDPEILADAKRKQRMVFLTRA